MASIEVRFKDGNMRQWDLADAMDLSNLAKALTRSTGARRSVSFGVLSEDGGTADFDFVGVAMGRGRVLADQGDVRRGSGRRPLGRARGVGRNRPRVRR